MDHLPGIYGGQTESDGRSILILPRDLGGGGYVFRLPAAGTGGMSMEPYPDDEFPSDTLAAVRFGRLFRGRHALEHRVIHVLHAGWPAMPESVRKASPYTMRCGSVIGTCVIAGALFFAVGFLVGHPWMGFAGLAASGVAFQAVKRWQVRQHPLAVTGTRLAAVLNWPFVASGITDDDCVLGAEMVWRVREAADGDAQTASSSG